MTTPSGTKMVRVSQETHARLMALADKLSGTADDAIAFLLGVSTVRVQVTDTQRERWEKAASAAGVTVPEYVRMRVEAAIQYGADPQGLQRIFEHVQALTAAAGVKPVPVSARPARPASHR